METTEIIVDQELSIEECASIHKGELWGLTVTQNIVPILADK